MSKLYAAVTVMVSLSATLFASDAGASAVVGNSSGSPTNHCESNAVECTVIGRRSANTSGVLTQFRLTRGTAPAATAVSFKTADAGIDNITRSTGSASISTTAGTSIFNINDGAMPTPHPAGIGYTAGEHIGVHVSSPMGTMPANLMTFKTADGGAGWYDGTGDMPVGAITGLPFFDFDGELLLSATLEPDVDGDEYGDESQDNCPTQSNDQTSDPCRPTITFLSVPPASSTNTTAFFSWRSSEHFRSSGTTFTCSKDGGAFQPCDDHNAPVNRGSASYVNVPIGSHTFSVRGADDVGDGAAATFGFTVEPIPPAPVPVTPAGPTGERDAALRRCKHKPKGPKRRRCIRAANQLPD